MKASYIEESNEEAKVETTSIGVNNLTDWAKEPSVKDLKQDLEDAQTEHDNHVKKVDVWLDNLNITGAAKKAKIKGRSSIVPKLIRKQAEWRYASLSEPFLSTEDVFNTTPVTYEDKKAAIQNGLVINNQFNTQIQKVKFFDEFIRTAVDEGTVVTRVGWFYQEEEYTEEVNDYEYRPSTNPLAFQQFKEIHELMGANPQQYAALPEVFRDLHKRSMEAGTPIERLDLNTTHEEKKTRVLKNHPTLEVCDYKNLIIDPSCEGDLKKAKFIIYRFQTSLAELEEEGKYKNLKEINIESSSILGAADNSINGSTNETFNFSDNPRKKFFAYEYWGFRDIHGDGKLNAFVGTWAGDTKIRMELNPFPDHELPFISAQYLPVRKSIYGEPDGELLEENQKVVGAVTRGMIDIMGRSANGQVGIRKDALDVTNKRKFDKGMDYEYNPTVNAQDVFYMNTFPEIPQSAEFMLNQQHAEAESLSGVKSFSSGISGAALGNTATGIRSALDATSKRELGILRRLAQGIKDIGRKMISMNSEFLDEEFIVRITNDEFVPVRKDDLAGNIDITLTISTAESDNEKAKELSFMLQTLGPNQDPEVTKMIQVEIARLRNMPALAKQIEDYQPQPDPIAQKKALLEVALLEAQVFNETAKGKENTVDVDLKKAKTVTEQAKGRNLDSKSDSQDLDYLEKESGADKDFEFNKKDHDRATQLDLKTADTILANEENEQETAPKTGTI